MSSSSPTLTPFVDVDLPLPDRRDGKVRTSYSLPGGRRLFVTTDRLSAFDRIIAGVPYKGQVLNQLAAWWFERTADVVANHVIAVPDPNLLVAREATTLPVEVVVRGYITGVTGTSLWRAYADGARTIYGYRFADGLRKNEPLPRPIVTPTTKPAVGSTVHDEPLTMAEVVDRGLVGDAMWQRIGSVALDVFGRGQAVAASAGLILADTKYEFGLDADGDLLLIDEVHTPDSSRFWVASTYESRLTAAEEPESLDKEVVRRALAAAGFDGNGDVPDLSPAVWSATTDRYIGAYQRLTGGAFTPGEYPVQERITSRLDDLREINE